jgi:primosomal protein N' (replication factor Y)
LQEREIAQYPPFAYFALLRAESPAPQVALGFVRAARVLATECRAQDGVELMDPVPAPMERRAGRYRAQLLVQARKRRPLHTFLSCWLTRLEQAPASKRVRWSLDVDPTDMY